LEKDGNKEIGLKFDTLFLSPFLCTGVTIKYFNLVGKTPVDNDLFIMQHNGELMKGALIFNNFMDTSS
jgi:hypothetical protein